MDGNRNTLLEQLKSCCKQRTDGKWALLAAAAGDEPCIQQLYNTLANYNWQYRSTIHDESRYYSKDFAEWRVFSISISRPNLLRELLDGWERQPNAKNFFADQNNCTDHIYLAGHTARNFFNPQQLDPTLESWSWEEYGSKTLVPKNLMNRPLKETILNLTDIQKSVAVGGDALRVLRTQEVKIEEKVFEHYSQSIDSTGCYVIALLIELSRKTDFHSDIWIENILTVFPKIQDPIDLLYITGGLLNPQWQIPSWYS